MRSDVAIYRMRRKVLLLLAIFLVIGIIAAILLFWLWRRSAPDLVPVEPPEGTQLLYFPMDKGLITAGYQNQNYLEKNGYPHYGIDVTTDKAGGMADILAAGSGIVLGTEHCDNSLGSIAVIRHDNVYVPQTGEVISFIGRYYHMTSLLIDEGDIVSPRQPIGTIDRSHEWHNHVHLELDTDLDYPFHTPQVAEASSELLHRYPANGDGICEPISVLVVAKNQRISVSPYARSCAEKDWPVYGEQ